MRQTKLTEILGALTPREHLRFRQFVWSDYCNRHKGLRALCDVVLNAAEHPAKILHKRQIFTTVFSENEPYNELKINNLFSDLYELLLDWLAIERQSNDTLEEQRQRALVLLERNLDKQAAAAIEKYQFMHERMPLRNAYWYRHAMHIEALKETLHSRQPRRTDSPHLLRQSLFSHYAHTLEKLSLGVALRSRSGLAVIQTADNSLINNELQAIRDDGALLHALPAASVYCATYELLEKPDQAVFLALTDALNLHHALFEKEEITSLYQCALNYCIHRINKGQPEAYTDALTLYRTLLDRGLLLNHSGRLSQWSYKNITTAGLRSGAFEWTENFLNQYREALPANERDNAFAFNIATLYFEKHDFEGTLKTLQNVEFTDITYHIGAKILQLKTFYLLKEDEPLIPLIAASEQLLRRDKTLSTFGKTTNLNFLKMLRQIVKWRQKRTRMPKRESQLRRKTLLEKVQTIQPMANKDWLLKMLEEDIEARKQAL